MYTLLSKEEINTLKCVVDVAPEKGDILVFSQLYNAWHESHSEWIY